MIFQKASSTLLFDTKPSTLNGFISLSVYTVFLTKLLVFVTDHLPGLTLHTRDVAEHLWLWFTVTNWAPFSECGTHRAFTLNCHTLILWPENVPCPFAPGGYSQLTFSFSKKIPLTSPVCCLPAYLVFLCISEQYVVKVSWVTGKCFPTLFLRGFILNFVFRIYLIKDGWNEAGFGVWKYLSFYALKRTRGACWVSLCLLSNQYAPGLV